MVAPVLVGVELRLPYDQYTIADNVPNQCMLQRANRSLKENTINTAPSKERAKETAPDIPSRNLARFVLVEPEML